MSKFKRTRLAAKIKGVRAKRSAKMKYDYKSGFPALIARKLYKTSQTRGADDDTYFQNRVGRNSTVLIPYRTWLTGSISAPPNSPRDSPFKNGFIVLISPADYFVESPVLEQPSVFIPKLVLGDNMLIVYERRQDWIQFNPTNHKLNPARSRKAPLGGHYLARVPNTTSDKDEILRHGYTSKETGGKGAGIRVFEYASDETIKQTRYQLAYLAWRTVGIFDLCATEQVSREHAEACKRHVDDYCHEHGLANDKQLEELRLIKNGVVVCPLCLEEIFARDLASRIQQASGREVVDQTITTANLFHLRELRVGEYNHVTNNLGWGHHYCNVVVADKGIEGTLNWMVDVLNRNERLPGQRGYLPAGNKAS